MDSFDDAEVCELFGLYLLNKVKPTLGASNLGLYRVDRLAIVRKANSPKLENLKKT